MKLSAPTKPLFVVAELLGITGILAQFDIIPLSGVEPFWLLAIGFVLLSLGAMLRGL